MPKKLDEYLETIQIENEKICMKDLIKTNSDFRNLIQDKNKRIKIFETFKEIS